MIKKNLNTAEKKNLLDKEAGLPNNLKVRVTRNLVRKGMAPIRANRPFCG